MNSLIKRNGFVFFYFLMLLVYNTQAQQKNYTLSYLTKAALQHYPLLYVDDAKIRSAEATVTDTRHAYLPLMGMNDQVNMGSANSISGGYLPISPVPSVSGGIRSGNNAQPVTGNLAVLYSSYELYNFGLKKAKINTANAAVNIEKAGLEQDRYYLKQQVGTLYFNLIKSTYQSEADADNVTRYSDIYRVIQALVNSGLKPGSDTSLAKAELSQAKTTYINTIGTVVNLRQQLSYLTGLDTAQLKMVALDTELVRNNPMIATSAVLYKYSLNHPFIDYIHQQQLYISSNDAVIKKNYLPKLYVAGSTWARGSSIQYNDNYQSLGEGLAYQRFNYMVGISISYDLFNGIRQKDKLKINHFQLQAMDRLLDQEKLYLENASLQAANDIRTSENNLLELPNQVNAATDVLNQKLAQYKAGLINLIDLTNAAFVLYRSKIDYIETQSNWFKARLDQAAAMGKLDEFINNLK